MKVVVTGHNGYIGTVMVDVLAKAGHDVTGLDTFYYEDCKFGSDRRTVPAIRKDLRDVDPGRSPRLRRRRPSRRAVERSARLPERRHHARHQPSRAACGWRKRRKPRACRDTCSPRRAASTARPAATTCSTRHAAFNPITAYGAVEGAGRAGRGEARRRPVHADLHAQRHGLRRLAAPARRHRRQQFRRHRLHDGRGAHSERRHAVAAARPHRRHLARRRRRAGRAERARPQPVVQCRQQRTRTTRFGTSPTS